MTRALAPPDPGESPLGKRVKFGGLDDDEHPWMEVVGRVAHVKNYGVDEASQVELYLPFLQSSASGSTLITRRDRAAGSVAAGMQQALGADDRDLNLYAVRPLDEIVAERSAERRRAALLIGVFATVALVLAAVGIYGVMSYAVAQRTQQIGIRMALGTEQEHVFRMVLRNGTALALSGIAIGLVAAFALARLIAALLFQTSTADPPTLSVVPLLLLAVSGGKSSAKGAAVVERVVDLASYLPARAARTDPMAALCCE